MNVSVRRVAFLGFCLAGESPPVVTLLSQAGISCFQISMARGSPQLKQKGTNKEENRKSSTFQKPEQGFEEMRTQE